MAILTEVFSCFFFSCKANARVKPAKTGHGPHSSTLLCCSMYCLCCSMYCLFCDVPSIICVCICVLNYCHRVATQLQLNISYHISYHILNVSYLQHELIYHSVPIPLLVHVSEELVRSFIYVKFELRFVCICVLNYCHRVATQLQSNISYHIISYHII